MRGGALRHVGSLTPDITGAEKLDELCEFDLIDAHGAAMTNNFMIVPENTFILFGTPSSSYYYSRKGKRLLTYPSNGSRDARATYMQNMYDVFFSGSRDSSDLRPYEGAYIYTPGDILHNTSISLRTNLNSPTFFRMGMYPLPIQNHEEFIHDKHRYIVEFIVNEIKSGKLDKGEFERQAGIKHAENWKKVMDAPDAKKAYLDIGDSNTAFQKLSAWFENLDYVLRNIIDVYATNSKHGNKISMADDLIFKDGRTTLAHILRFTEKDKKYRFIVVHTCRPPDIRINVPTLMNNERVEELTLPNPGNMPLNAPPSWRTTRRASFSAKGEDVVCPLGPGVRPMNLARLKTALKDFLFSEPSKLAHLTKQEEQLITYISDTVFAIVPYHRMILYQVVVPLDKFSILIDLIHMKYPPPENRNAPEASKRIEFMHILETARGIFRDYVLGFRLNVHGMAREGADETIGYNMLKHFGRPTDPLLPWANRKQNIKNMIRAMEAEPAAMARATEYAEKVEKKKAEAAAASAEAKKRKIEFITSSIERYTTKLDTLLENMETYEKEGKFTLPDITTLQPDAVTISRNHPVTVAEYYRSIKQPVTDAEYYRIIYNLMTSETSLYKTLTRLDNLNIKIRDVIHFININFKQKYEFLTKRLNIENAEHDFQEEITSKYKPMMDTVMEIYNKAISLDESLDAFRIKIQTMIEEVTALRDKYRAEVDALHASGRSAAATTAPKPAAAAAPKPAAGKKPHQKQAAPKPPAAAAAAAPKPPAAAAAAAPKPPAASKKSGAATTKETPAWVVKMREKQAARNAAAKTKKGGRRLLRRRRVTRRLS
jgi:hypothetical protein